MIELGSLEVADLTDGYLFEFRSGGPDDLATYRGEDDVVPETAGLSAGLWIANNRDVTLYGIVIGEGDDFDELQVSYRSRMDALVTVMDPSTLLTITAQSPVFGMGAGQVATLENCRPQRIMGPPSMGDQARIITLELLCIDSPPQWVIGS